jgi:hypothetical protein
MKINITFEVNSREAIVEILQTGKDRSLLDYKILDFEINEANMDMVKLFGRLVAVAKLNPCKDILVRGFDPNSKRGIDKE